MAKRLGELSPEARLYNAEQAIKLLEHKLTRLRTRVRSLERHREAFLHMVGLLGPLLNDLKRRMDADGRVLGESFEQSLKLFSAALTDATDAQGKLVTDPDE